MAQIAKNLKDRIGDTLSRGSALDQLHSLGTVKNSFKYFVVFLILGTGLSVLLSHFILNFTQGTSFPSLISVLAIIVLFALFLIFQTLLVRNFHLYLWICIFEGAALFSYFYKSVDSLLLFAGVVFIWSLIMAFHDGRRLIRQRVDFSFFRYAQVVSAPVMRSFSLFLAIFFVGLYAMFGMSAQGFDFMMHSSEPFIEPLVPGFSKDMNANDFYYSLARAQVERAFKDTEQFDSLTELQREDAIITVARELRNKVGEFTKTPVEADDTSSRYFYKIAVKYFPKVDSSSTGIFSALLIALAIYSLLATFALIVRVLILVPISWILYQAVYGLGLISIERKTIEKDTLNLM